jgi:hypothetical protein
VNKHIINNQLGKDREYFEYVLEVNIRVYIERAMHQDLWMVSIRSLSISFDFTLEFSFDLGALLARAFTQKRSNLGPAQVIRRRAVWSRWRIP